jgi:hypothetical protein
MEMMEPISFELDPTGPHESRPITALCEQTCNCCRFVDETAFRTEAKSEQHTTTTRETRCGKNKLLCSIIRLSLTRKAPLLHRVKSYLSRQGRFVLMHRYNKFLNLS